MIITKIEIEQFGKHKNFTLDFSDGVNVIDGQNEAGKSTLCAFISAMFYGIPNESKKLGIREDARKRYLPWDGGAMSGSIHFTADDRSYVLSRRFAKTRRSDKVSLKDAVTWEEISDISPEEIGHTFLGVGEEAFLKTLFISQLGAAILPGGDDEILKRLSNLGQSGAEDTSYQAAAAALEKAQHELLSKSERAGKIPKLEQEKSELLYELAESKRVQEQFKEDILLQGRLKQEGDALAKEAKELSSQKEKAKEYARFLKQQKAQSEINRISERKAEGMRQITEQKQKIEKLEKQADAYKCVVDVSQAELLELAQEEKEIEEIKEQITGLEAKKEQLVKLKEQLAESKSKQRLGINIPMLIIAVLVMIIGIFAGIFASAVMFLLIPVGVLLLAVAFAGRIGIKKQKEELENSIAALQNECSDDKMQMLKDRLRILRNKLDEVLISAGAADVKELARRVEEKQHVVQDISSAQKELTLLEDAQKHVDEDEKRFSNTEQESFSDEVISYRGPLSEEIDALLDENHRKQMENQRRYETTRYKVEEALVGTRSTDVILSELAQNEEKLLMYHFHYDALCMAQETLEKSYMELKKDFAPVLNEKVGEILSVLTDGKYSELKVADDYKIMLKEQDNGEIVSAEYLSSGTYDILYFALRLGIAQVIFSGKIPLLILDDTFLQLDDKRAKAAAKYLKEQTSSEQIIYFTCHKSQAELFGNDNNRITI